MVGGSSLPYVQPGWQIQAGSNTVPKWRATAISAAPRRAPDGREPLTRSLVGLVTVLAIAVFVPAGRTEPWVVGWRAGRSRTGEDCRAGTVRMRPQRHRMARPA